MRSSIESAVITYLNEHADLVDLHNKVFYRRVPTSETMPWLVVTNAGGIRQNMTVVKTEDIGTLTLYLDCIKQFEGFDMACRVASVLENYRGTMNGINDVYIKVGPPRDLDTFLGGFRYVIMCYYRYSYDRVQNP